MESANFRHLSKKNEDVCLTLGHKKQLSYFFCLFEFPDELFEELCVLGILKRIECIHSLLEAQRSKQFSGFCQDYLQITQRFLELFSYTRIVNCVDLVDAFEDALEHADLSLHLPVFILKSLETANHLPDGLGERDTPPNELEH